MSKPCRARPDGLDWVCRRLAVPAILALAISLPGTAAFAGSEGQPQRPSIWVSAADRPNILSKIEESAWALRTFESLRERADEAAPLTLADRRSRILALPLVWSEESRASPVLMSFTRDNNAPVNPEAARQLRWNYPVEPQLAILKGLQDAIDCGVLFYLTEEERYAICAADILHVFVDTLNRTPPPINDTPNSGWLYRQDHLLEARLVGAQLPIIYDLVHPYLASDGEVYDVGADALRPFSIADAQHVFRTYADLALHRGLYDSNWPLLEMSSLLNNVLAVDDAEERAALLVQALETGTDRQPSLAALNEQLSTPGSIWPESLTYSFAVARFLIYAMALLDRNFPDLDLGQKYPNVLDAYETYHTLQFPNGDYPAFGDSRRRIGVDFLNYEIALGLSQISGNAIAKNRIESVLRSSEEAGVYDRGQLPNRGYGAEPYTLPLKLLWSVPSLDDGSLVDLNPPRPRTVHLPFAGIAVQRNVDRGSTPGEGLMAVMGGGAYIHGHASGIDLELYGQGAVLGVESGRGVYGSDIHENYYRLFAAHNTVISNGGSASSGQWVGLGTDIARIVAIEPALGTPGASSRHSFATMQFRDAFNLVAPAEHQRTVAIVRLTPTQGYYLDVFRARSEGESQFHDYVYRNVADALSLTSGGEEVSLTPDTERYAASSSLIWERNRRFRHPGWHFFRDSASAAYGDGPLVAEFTAADLGDESVRMRALIPGGVSQQVTRVAAPTSSVAEPPYDDRSIPAFVLRRQGETWSNPFVVLYESDRGQAAVRSVERLMDGQTFKGVRVTSEVEGREIVQYILIQEQEQVYNHPEVPIEFLGTFGILTLSSGGRVEEAYIGDGRSLSYGDFILETARNASSAYWTAE